MSKISKELIESYRKVVLPFVSKQLLKADFEGQGETDKTEFEHDFNEILDLALSALNPSGDCISREVINSEIEKRYCSKHCVVPSEEPYCPARFLKNIVKECPPVPQVTVFTESTDEKAVADMKAELQSVIEARPQGSWETDNIGIYCSVCKKHLDVETPFCPLCGADMRGGANMNYEIIAGRCPIEVGGDCPLKSKGRYIDLDLAKRIIAKFDGYLDEDMITRIQIALEKESKAEND